MHLSLRVLILGFVSLTASPVLAQSPTPPTPEPLPLGMPYVYQVGNPYWYQPFTYTVSAYGTYSSPYPFGSTRPVFGLYSWDSGVYYPTTSARTSDASSTWNPNATWTTPAATWSPTTGWVYPAATWNATTGWVYPAAYPIPGRIFLGGSR
jgi:hypothetical protein